MQSKAKAVLCVVSVSPVEGPTLYRAHSVYGTVAIKLYFIKAPFGAVYPPDVLVRTQRSAG